MQTIAIITVLAAFGGPADGVGGDTLTVSDVLDTWSKRENLFPGGEIGWTIPAENGNLFGRLDSKRIPTTGPAGCEIAGAVRFDRKQARYDGITFSCMEFGAPFSDLAAKKISFLKNLLTGAQTQYVDLLPYTVCYSPDRRVHLWHAGPTEYPRAVILPSERTGDSTPFSNFIWGALEMDGYGSVKAVGGDESVGPSVSLHRLLVAPILLTFRPSLFDRGFSQADVCHIVDDLRPVHEGKSCIVLRAAALAENDQSGPSGTSMERIYWVDPSRDCLVVRYMAKQGDTVLSQVDISYDQPEGVGWVPSKWTVLRLGDLPTVVRQYATAERTHVDLQRGAPVVPVELKFPAGTWVADAVTPRRYLVRDDFSEYEIQESYEIPTTYTDIVARSQGRVPTQRSENTKTMRRALVALTCWPGLLVPAALISAVLVLAGSIFVGWKDTTNANQPESVNPPRNKTNE